jgi:hypothetical protein
MNSQADENHALSLSPPLPQQGGQIPSGIQQAAAPSQPPRSAVVAPVAAVSDESSNDLDEEWVRKAKEIVEKTKDDPFQASKELGKMKADYLRIRYNKQIKVAEDHPK